MMDYKLISADSHVSEPTDLWVERVDKRYRDRAPRLVKNPADPNGAYFHYEGYQPHPIGIGLAAGKSPEELAQFLTQGTYADARPGGWDPAERLKDNELDGVEADVLYTTLGFRIFWLKDAGLQQDCFRVYNDWLAAYCNYAPARMAGLAMICLYDPKAGAQELAWTAPSSGGTTPPSSRSSASPASTSGARCTAPTSTTMSASPTATSSGWIG